MAVIETVSIQIGMMRFIFDHHTYFSLQVVVVSVREGRHASGVCGIRFDGQLPIAIPAYDTVMVA